MKSAPALATSSLAVLAFLILSAPPIRADEPMFKYEAQPEFYTEHGEASGCGISFTAAWVQDKKHTVAVTGSVNIFFDSGKKNVFSLLKVSGLFDAVHLPVSYGWVETATYGKTTDFTGHPGIGEDVNGFIAVKYSDPKTFTIPWQMAELGYTFGVAFSDQPVDSVIKLPPATDPTVANKINDCLNQLMLRMQAVLGQ